MHNQTDYPRPEYPRPDRQRGTVEGTDWLNLNGPWQFRFDGDDRGRRDEWFSPDKPEWDEQIIVPFCWESLAAWGEGDTAGNDNYYATRVFRNPLEVNRSNHRSAARYEIGWYRRRVAVPTGGEWEGKRAILTVGASDFFTDCWCNGIHLGHHEGGYTPFEFDLTDALESTTELQENGVRYADIVFRVYDPMDNHEQPVGKQWQWYTTTSGIWQTVFVEPRSASHIDSFRFVTDIDTSAVQFLFECVQADDCEIEVEVTAPDGARLTTRLPVNDNIAEGNLKLSPLFLWDPNEPHLYDVRLCLLNGQREVDCIRTYFGMRKIDAAPTGHGNIALRLNGVPRYLRGALYQSYHPDGVYTAGDAQVLKDDIAFAIKAGFNFLRIHIKIDDPVLLYYADKMGMMLMADFPNFGEGGDTPTGRRRYEEMMRAAVKRDFNHPSIVAWCLFNETWGFGGQVELVKLFPHLEPSAADIAFEAPTNAVSAEEPQQNSEPIVESGQKKLENRGSHQWVQNIWELAKALDSTRLIEDMSVVHWEHLDYYQHGDTDINSWHFYINDYERAKAHIEKIAADTFEGSSFNYVEGYQQRAQPLINSEYGGVGALDGDCDVSWSFRFLTNELRRQGKISAYIYTELTDVEWEYNGFLNYDRTFKEFGYDPVIINGSNVLPIGSPPISRHDPGATVSVDVSSSHYSSHGYKEVSLQWRLSGIDRLGKIHQDIVRGSVPIDFPHWQVAHAHTVKLQLPNEPMLCSLSLVAMSEKGEVAAQNYLQYLAANAYPPEREDTESRVILRGTPVNWAHAAWSGPHSERDFGYQNDYCFGDGRGFFEWHLSLDGIDLARAKRLRVLCEASSHRADTSQTDDHDRPTTLQMQLNDLRVYQAKVANHPHDSRGALSYLRGGKGAYGYLAHATVEGELLHHIASRSGDGILRFRCGVPESTLAAGGLTIYGAECGRFPVAPTVVIEW